MSVEPVVIDLFDADGLRNAMAHVRPSVVVHTSSPRFRPVSIRAKCAKRWCATIAYASGRREETPQLLVQQRV
jgi:hypothetical protein